MSTPVTQEMLEKIAQMNREGRSDREIAKELGICNVSISRWRAQGRLPAKVKPHTNNGKMREYEPLPELRPGYRLDGTPIIKEEKKVIEVEKAEVEEKVPKAPVVPVKSRIRRSITLEGEYMKLDIGGDSLVDISGNIGLYERNAKETLEILMALDLELHELIDEVTKLI